MESVDALGPLIPDEHLAVQVETDDGGIGALYNRGQFRVGPLHDLLVGDVPPHADPFVRSAVFAEQARSLVREVANVASRQNDAVLHTVGFAVLKASLDRCLDAL